MISSTINKRNKVLKITNKKYFLISNHYLNGNFKLTHEVIIYNKYKGLPSLPINFNYTNSILKSLVKLSAIKTERAKISKTINFIFYFLEKIILSITSYGFFILGFIIEHNFITLANIIMKLNSLGIYENKCNFIRIQSGVYNDIIPIKSEIYRIISRNAMNFLNYDHPIIRSSILLINVNETIAVKE